MSASAKLHCYSTTGQKPQLPASVNLGIENSLTTLLSRTKGLDDVALFYAAEQNPELETSIERFLQASPMSPVIVLLDTPPKELKYLVELGVQEVVHGQSQVLEQDLQQAVETAQARKKREYNLQHRAHHDDLTQLANRQLFKEKLDLCLEQHKRQRRDLTLLMMDLDRFHVVNDQYGHVVGDELLRAAAERLLSCTRGTDTLARMGGNTFAVVVENLFKSEDAEKIANKLCQQFQAPFLLDGGEEVYSTVSIGVQLARAVNYDADAMLQQAELAMQHAKVSGRNQFYVYRRTTKPEVRIRGSLETALHHAIANGEISLEYQPQISVSQTEFTGVEALMRWNHPQLGAVSPVTFIPILEETGLIHEFGKWGLNEACSQFKKWLDAGTMPANARVSVNLSARQFSRSDLAEQICSILRTTGLPPTNLTLEITESMIMKDQDYSVDALTTLRSKGIAIAVDDFGTGYSSLAYLKSLPVDYLKIDRVFVKDLNFNGEDQAIADSIIRLAHNLRLDVVAEGVEDDKVLDILQRLGCDYYQGYYFAKPVPADQIPALVERCA